MEQKQPIHEVKLGVTKATIWQKKTTSDEQNGQSREGFMIAIDPKHVVIKLGNICVSEKVKSTFHNRQIVCGLVRHITGDWGDVDVFDWEANEEALAQGTRIVSIYQYSKQDRLMIITEADRSQTTVLVPEEY